MKTIKVVAAIICDNIKEKNKIFATARGYGELKGGWEFPGGKIEAGETPQEALKSEIMEELKARYEEMAENRTKVGERLVKAFPKMQVRQHKEIFEELRERVRRKP